MYTPRSSKKHLIESKEPVCMDIASKDINRRSLLSKTEKMVSSVLEDYNSQIESTDILESLFVFGSVGADKANSDSDLDMLLVLRSDYTSHFDSQERSKDFLSGVETHMNMWPSILIEASGLPMDKYKTEVDVIVTSEEQAKSKLRTYTNFSGYESVYNVSSGESVSIENI